jgi:carbamoyltransferase
MYILGLNCVWHESAACVLHAGSIVAAAEEERFNRRKHCQTPLPEHPDRLPLKAIAYCLNEAGIELADISHIGYSSSPEGRIQEPPRPHLPWWDQIVYHMHRVPGRLRDLGFKGQFLWVDHHTAHASSAFFASPFEDAAVLSIDGIGDVNTSASYEGHGRSLRFLQDVAPPNSVGLLWELFAMLLGFDVYDAGKVMGLAGYGDPKRFARHFRRFVTLLPEGRFSVLPDVVRFEEINYVGPTVYLAGLEALFQIRRRLPGEELSQEHIDIAAGLQEVTNQIVLHLVRHLHGLCRSSNLCLAGGVALNCQTNRYVFEEGPFQQFYVQPAAHDGGTAVGAAYHVCHQLLGKPRNGGMSHAFLGPLFPDDEIVSALGRHHLKYHKCDDIERQVAQLLSTGKIVGYFQGRMEFGPRALGNRSLLADPRNPGVCERLNEFVKHREEFRPYGASVTHEAAGQWFRIKKGTPAMEFMLMAYPVQESVEGRIPAVTHVNSSSRVHTVRREINPSFHRLLTSFGHLTGVPVLLNTSFNDREPIVCSPDEAIRTFLSTEIDALALEDFLIMKTDN